MKALTKIFAFVAMMLTMGIAAADAVYPYTNPTYIPTAASPAATYSAPADYTMTTNGLNSASLRITGTCTSLAGSVQGSNDGTNWTDISIYQVGGGNRVKSFSAVGFWRADVAGFTRVRAHITALTASCTVSMAGTQGPVFNVAYDPCQDPSVAKSSIAVNLGASATTAMVAAVTGKTTYICSVAASAVGTNPTLTFKYGTQTTNPCDTGAVNLSGAMIPAAADGMLNMGTGSTVMQSAASTQLCITTGATTSIQGIMTYVQQ